MAILNFPNAAGQPTDGSFTYEDNGVLYSWDGYKWTANSEPGYDTRYVEVTGDTMTGDLTVPSLNGGPLAGLRNQLINGDFRVAQRSTSLTTGNGYKTCDRWYQESTSGNVQTKRRLGFGQFALAIQLKDATSSGESYIAQGIELPLTGSNGQFVENSIWTVSFWSTVAPSGIGVAFRDSMTDFTTGDTCPVNTITVGETIDGYTHYSAQTTITSASATRTCLRIKLAYTAPVDAYITGCQLEPGPVATPFEHRPEGLEMSLCQRYFQKSTDSLRLFLANAAPSTAKYISYFRPVTMRTAPTETGTLTAGTISLKGTAESMIVSANSLNESSGSKLQDYTADAEL